MSLKRSPLVYDKVNSDIDKFWKELRQFEIQPFRKDNCLAWHPPKISGWRRIIDSPWDGLSSSRNPSIPLQSMGIASPNPSYRLRRMLHRSRHVATSGEQSRDGDIFIDRLPMQANTAQLHLLAFC